jgi:hypothetical protein
VVTLLAGGQWGAGSSDGQWGAGSSDGRIGPGGVPPGVSTQSGCT